MKEKKPNRFYQDRYDDRNKNSGLVRVTIWVPNSHREHIKRYAKKLRIVYERTKRRVNPIDMTAEIND